MDGYILKFSEVAMAYPKVESWTTTWFERKSTSQVVLNLQRPQLYGSTPGVLSDFALLWMTLVLNTFVENMPTTFAKSSRTIMKSQKIGKENFQALTGNIIMPPSKMATPAAYKSTDILRNYFSDLATSARSNLSSRPTSITIFTMDPKYNWTQKRKPSQVSMIRESSVYIPL